MIGLPGALWPAGPSAEQLLARPGLLDLLGDEALVRRLGAHYRSAFPAEGEAKALRAAVLAGKSPGVSLPEHLETRIRDDFRDGRTVVLEGWVLARTEARQCALCSLGYR